MMHERFKFRNKNDLILKSGQLGFELPFSDDISSLLRPLLVGDRSLGNRLVVQPMEGYDSEPDGSPSDLTRRRYLRYAEGGSGIIWSEAVSVMNEGRSNPRQLWLHKDNIDNYEFLSEDIRKHASGNGYNPLLVMQLTHSGRYSKPAGKPRPLVAAPNTLLDREPATVLSDDDLKKIQDHFVNSARLALLAGFDAIDIKACHGYLVHELLSCRGRSNSPYGGHYASDRFRFLLETIDRIRVEVPGIIITVRLSIWDGYEGGFGVGNNDSVQDYSEPEMLIGELLSRGVKILNTSMGNPYFNPHVTRPFDNPLPGTGLPGEHPLEGVMRMINGISRIQQKFPQLPVIGSAYSYLRQFAPNVSAAVLENNGASLIGFGRSSFAYPSMPKDLMEKGYADPEKVCITCSGCTRLIRNFRPGGCVIHDREIYGNELKKLIADGKK